MGTKKQGMTILKGSLKTHWMMYINHVNLQVNPADTVGISNAHAMLRLVGTLNSKYVQPGFEFKHQMIEPETYYQPSLMHLKFCNGYERKYNIGITSMGNIKREIEAIN